MDLVAPLSHSINVLDQIYEHVESVYSVDRPLKLGYFETLVTKDHGEDLETMGKFYPETYCSYNRDLFEQLLSAEYRESLAILRDSLLKIIHSESLPSPVSKVSQNQVLIWIYAIIWGWF